MIRPPAVAGRFYPSEPARLNEELDSLLATGTQDRKIRAQACLVPHAGYKYSGQVAGAVYSRMEIPVRVILLGPRHYPRGASFAILSDGAWQTPLGMAPIDHLLAEKIMRACPLLREDGVAHDSEHSLEVQLPFLQRLAPSFGFVPIVIGPAQYAELEALGELRAPFDLDRQQIDDVERGANDSDWQPAKDAARRLAFAEDRAIFEGYAAAGIEGMRQGTSNPATTLPADVRDYPDAIAQALSQLRLVGVNGPYSVLLSADAYTGLSETRDHGYPVLEHIKRLVDGEIIWAPAIAGAFVLTTRGGDFGFYIGQDISIGYLSHTDAVVRLYLQETFTFLLLTTEAAVALAPPGNARLPREGT